MMATATQNVSALLKRTKSAGDELRDGVEGIRRTIRETEARREEEANRPCEMTIAVARAEEWLSQLCAAETLSFPDGRAFASAPGAYQRPMVVDMREVAAAYLEDQIRAGARRQIETYYANVDPVTETERANRLEKLDRDLLDLELAEESIIRAAEASGFPMMRRAEANPLAVLAHDKALP